MHLPCQNCKGLQPFSGEPPICDVCGWEAPWSKTTPPANPTTKRSVVKSSEETNLRAVARFAGMLCAIAIGLMVFWYGGIELLIWLAPESRYGYAFKYTDSADQVFIEPKPHDCEWGKAPIGSKYCHFERHISFANDEHGNIKAVYVTWEKVQD